MNYKVGDFIKSKHSKTPGIIIKIQDKDLLVSITEFGGDYIWIAEHSVEPVNLKSEEKLSILANFGDWFYDQHLLLYQEIIIENLQDFNKISIRENNYLKLENLSINVS